MKNATGNSLLYAFSKAAKTISEDDDMLEIAKDAGMIIPNGQKKGSRTGWQVFVTISKWDEQLLKADRMTGGLVKLKKRK